MHGEKSERNWAGHPHCEAGFDHQCPSQQLAVLALSFKRLSAAALVFRACQVQGRGEFLSEHQGHAKGNAKGHAKGYAMLRHLSLRVAFAVKLASTLHAMREPSLSRLSLQNCPVTLGCSRRERVREDAVHISIEPSSC